MAHHSPVYVLSDIEGQLDAFRQLLLAGQVIDRRDHWIFGRGHLVLLGDMMDRGDRVVEVLDLIRELEIAAEKTGGQVHFVLGNHEVMNFSGDYRYVAARYLKRAGVLKADYAKRISPRSETGQWLRSKDILLKIGDTLFVHAGISPLVNGSSLTLDQMNDLAKQYYDQGLFYQFPSMILQVPEPDRRAFAMLFDPEESPFWYRGYYWDAAVQAADRPLMQAQLSDTLIKFGVQRIVTGHTIVSEQVTSYFDGKLFNTDTDHAAGHSEALLIEEDGVYRVSKQGEKMPV